MNDIKFDAILNLNDADFAQKFLEAIGAKPGETIRIKGPQFERTDGVVPSLPADSWERLCSLSKESLKALGCCAWDEPDARGMVLMLFPHEWYSHIPAGYEIVCINGDREQFVPGETDDDMRFGCLAYGIEVPAGGV